MITDIEKRKKELIVNLNRKMIVDELNKYLTLQLDSFISIEDTLVLQNELFKKVDSIKNFKILDKDVSTNLEEVYKLRNFFEDYLMHKVVLFYHKARDYGAFEIYTKDFFDNIDQLASFTKFKEGYFDLLFVERDLRFGLCIERNEYDNKLTYWK